MSWNCHVQEWSVCVCVCGGGGGGGGAYMNKIVIIDNFIILFNDYTFLLTVMLVSELLVFISNCPPMTHRLNIPNKIHWLEYFYILRRRNMMMMMIIIIYIYIFKCCK